MPINIYTYCFINVLLVVTIPILNEICFVFYLSYVYTTQQLDFYSKFSIGLQKSWWKFQNLSIILWVSLCETITEPKFYLLLFDIFFQVCDGLEDLWSTELCLPLHIVVWESGLVLGYFTIKSPRQLPQLTEKPRLRLLHNCQTWK